MPAIRAGKTTVPCLAGQGNVNRFHESRDLGVGVGKYFVIAIQWAAGHAHSAHLTYPV